MQKKLLLATVAILGSIQLSAYTYEVNPLIGKNFTEDGALVDDSTAFGIRLNKYISEDNAIMFGYTRINSADYKRTTNSLKGLRSTSGCTTPVPCKPVVDECGGWYEGKWDHCNKATDNGNDTDDDTSSSNVSDGLNDNNMDDASDTSTGQNTPTNGNGDTPTETTTPTTTTGTGEETTPNKKVLSNTSRDTDINRFYINGLHNIKTKYSRLVPYVYGGFGYEDVENEFDEYKSQGFFNAGGGLKFRINDKLNLVSDIQAIKKFKSHDLDILGSLGISFLFGKAFQPEPEALVASGVEDIQPAAEPKRKITIVKVAPQPKVEAPVITAPKGEYYVQMAAGFKTDMETGCKHTKDLRDAGIDYKIKYTTVKGKNAALVVVGPYETKAEATDHLAALKKYSKDAFVKKIAN
jgi:hypothetical protein